MTNPSYDPRMAEVETLDFGPNGITRTTRRMPVAELLGTTGQPASDWTGSLGDLARTDDGLHLRGFHKGARVLVNYADDRPDEMYIVDDVRDGEDGMSTILDIRADDSSDPRALRWYGADDPPAP